MRLRISSETVRPPHLESAGEEGLEVRIVDPSDVKEGGGLVEGAAGTGEHRAHFICAPNWAPRTPGQTHTYA